MKGQITMDDKAKIAWEKFKNSGKIEDYLEYKRIQKNNVKKR